MRYIILLLLSFLFTSCGVYQISTTPKVKITKILTLTSTGDTIAVPLRDFQKYHFNNYDFNRFNYFPGPYWNSWNYPYYGGYGLFSNNSWYYRDWYYTPPIYNSPLIRPQIESPVRVNVNGRRGSSNNNDNLIDRVIDKLNNRGINVDVIENNDQINRNNIRGYRPSQGSNNGGRSWSGENIPVKPAIPIITPPSQPRQIRGGSGPSGVQQSISRGSSSGQRGSGTGRQQN